MKTAALATLVWLGGPATAADWTLRLDGIGPLRIGMRFDEANAAVGSRLAASDPSLQASPGCDEIPLPMHPGVSLMFIDGVLKRVDVFAAGTRTANEIAVGDPVARVHAIYPRARREDHFYNSAEQYLTVDSADSRYSLRFETEGGKIAHFYAGAREQVRYVEGCL
ncbi:hypothetical protein [Massilia litorea]|jgi:hypothetical protein|uniref:Uncharacterized protein n=1 Tax=Massilia litorea TaxID=2769491 RepID=A0A7L9UCF7_9BURK|nr:hypothetical protein [Massilia litorea]QOL51806.1 hypothetical protein LPB04_11465 [Massilia litorea]